MILLTKANANERCRTCLCKLLKDEDNPCDEGTGAMYSSKIVDINTNKEIQKLLEKYISTQWDSDFNKEKLFPHYLCMACFKQLETFDVFRSMAFNNTRKLYIIFSNSCKEAKIELNDDGHENNIEETPADCLKNNVFNFSHKDSLMEPEAVILNDVCGNNDQGMDPDPFQNTQKLIFIKKPRGRNTKSKNSIASSNKTCFQRKEKAQNSNKDGTSRECNQETNVYSYNKVENEASEEDETAACKDALLQSSDDSSDNEVLSKKISHSDKEAKDRTNLIENYRGFNAEALMGDTQKILCSNQISTNNFKIEEISSEYIKREISSNDDLSSETEFENHNEMFPKSVKVEKKKRHILNSGRKKGLANRYKCDQCHHKFGHKQTLEAHIRKVHEGQKKAFKCQLCDKAYSFIGGLSTHIRDVHERKQESYDCSVPGCEKKYSNFITLQRHVRFKHLNVETPHQYVCEQCGATFKQSSNLRYHMKTRHPTEEDLKRKELVPKDRLECEECKKSFHSQYTLKYHKLRVHADEKKFECKICGRRVAKQFMLDSHMLVHSDQKMACKFCGREFVRKYQVEAHIKAVHQKLKPFQCPHCSESFASRKTLRHHVYIHTGEKPYVCDICGQAYRQPTCLKNHRKVHNKSTANNEPTAPAASRNFLSNFLLNNDDENETK